MKKYLRILFLFAFCTLSGILSAQSWQWAKSVYGPDFDQIKAVEADNRGYVYVTGWYQDTLYFNASTFFVAATNYYDGFIAKYDDQGNFIWAKKFGANRDDAGYELAIDTSGNIYVAGYSRSTTALVYGSFSFTGTGNDKTFMLKLDENGNLIWGKLVTAGTSNAYPTGIDVNNNNQVILTGTYAFLDLTIDATVLPHEGSEDIFYAMFSAVNGSLIWAKRAYAPFYDYSHSAVIDEAGNCYISAITYGNIIIDGVGTLPPGGTSYIGFVFKSDSLGNFIWAKKYSNTVNGGVVMSGLELAGSGDLYVTGWIGSGFTLNLNDTTFSDLGTAKQWLQKINSGGNSIWTKTYPCSSLCRVNGIAVDSADNVFLGGYVAGSIFFDNIMVQPNVGGYAFFLGMIDKNGVAKAGAWGGNNVNNTGLDVVSADHSGGAYVVGHFGNTAGDVGLFGNDTLVCDGPSDGFLAKYNYSDILYCTANASFTASSLTVCNGDTVVFTNFSSGTGIPSYTWRSDGNIFSTADDTFIVFSSTGNHTIQLTASNAYCSDSVSAIIQVLNTADSVLSPVYSCTSDSVLIFGTYFSNAGWYYDTLQTATGCDSIISQELIHYPDYNQNVNASICNGENYLLPDGNIVVNPGTYVSILPTSNGCDSSITTTLAVNTVDTSIILSGITLSANSSGNYQWLDCGSAFAVISGENGQIFTPAANGNYAVEITEGVCVDTSSCYLINSLGTDGFSSGIWSLYPNPADQIITINGGFVPEGTVINVYDIAGKAVLNKTLVENIPPVVFVGNLDPGLYSLQITSGTITKLFLFIRQ